MPKGKRKDKFPQDYPSDDESTLADRLARAAAPQSKAHKRGGIHRVKEDNLTGTIWDHASRTVMLNAAQGKSSGGEPAPEFKKYTEFFDKFKGGKTRIRDLKKEVLLQTLGEAEKELARRAKSERKEAVKAGREAEKRKKVEEEKRVQEEKKRMEEKKRKRDAEELVTDSEGEEGEAPSRKEARKSPDRQRLEDVEQRPERYTVYDQGSASDSTDTTTTQDFDSPTSRLPKLSLFEWSRSKLPSSDWARTPRAWPTREENQPKKIVYVPLHVVSTITQEPLRLPGRNYKTQDKDPDSVPRLSEHVKDCARNGVLLGKLSGARIESGRDWAKRTLVQGWNGHMYFNLPARRKTTDDQDLAQVYREWKRNRKAARKSYYGIQKSDPRLKKFRAQQERDLTRNVYESSQWRPLLGFCPAYLGPLEERLEEGQTARKNIGTLFYVVLEEENLPSYYFWADEEEWANPMEPNPDFEQYEDPRVRRTSNGSSASHPGLQSRRAPWRRLSSFSRQAGFVRVKKVPGPRKFRPNTKIPKTSRYKAAVWTIERELYNNGYDATLRKYQQKWLGEGKREDWVNLTKFLRSQLPPSGFPRHPPIRDGRDPYMISVAEKMARVEAPSASRPILPMFIQDDWTRDDDAYWTTQERIIPKTPVDNDVIMQTAPSSSRSSTTASPEYLARRVSDVFNWVSRVSSVTSDSIYQSSREEQVQQEANIAFRVMTDQLPIAIPQWDIWRMMQERHQLQRNAPQICAICLQDLGNVPLEDYEQHLINHMVHIAHMCPFCEMPWEDLAGEDKGDHVMRHRPTKDGDVLARRGSVTRTPPELQTYAAYPRRRSSLGGHSGREVLHLPPTPSELQARAAVPRQRSILRQPSASSGRKPSVHFSPTTVGRRVGYNDAGPTQPPAPGRRRLQPRRSSLRINTDHAQQHRSQEYEIINRESQYRQAYEARRKASEDSLNGVARALVQYVLPPGHSDEHAQDDWLALARTEARMPENNRGKSVEGWNPPSSVETDEGEEDDEEEAEQDDEAEEDNGVGSENEDSDQHSEGDSDDDSEDDSDDDDDDESSSRRTSESSATRYAPTSSESSASHGSGSSRASGEASSERSKTPPRRSQRIGTGVRARILEEHRKRKEEAEREKRRRRKEKREKKKRKKQQTGMGAGKGLPRWAYPGYEGRLPPVDLLHPDYQGPRFSPRSEIALWDAWHRRLGRVPVLPEVPRVGVTREESDAEEVEGSVDGERVQPEDGDDGGVVDPGDEEQRDEAYYRDKRKGKRRIQENEIEEDGIQANGGGSDDDLERILDELNRQDPANRQEGPPRKRPRRDEPERSKSSVESNVDAGKKQESKGPPKCCEHNQCPCLAAWKEKKRLEKQGGGGGGGGGSDDDDSGGSDGRDKSGRDNSKSPSNGDKDKEPDPPRRRKSHSSSSSSSAFEEHPHAARRRFIASRPEWQPGVPLWVNLRPNPLADLYDELNSSDEELAGVDRDTAAALLSVKRATGMGHVVGADGQDGNEQPKQDPKQKPGKKQNGRRSSAPSPTDSSVEGRKVDGDKEREEPVKKPEKRKRPVVESESESEGHENDEDVNAEAQRKPPKQKPKPVVEDGDQGNDASGSDHESTQDAEKDPVEEPELDPQPPPEPNNNNEDLDNHEPAQPSEPAKKAAPNPPAKKEAAKPTAKKGARKPRKTEAERLMEQQAAFNDWK